MRLDTLSALTQKNALLLSLCFLALYAVEAKKYVLRPLSADEVYRLLSQSARTGAIPEGRIVTQGLAAISDLATGLTRVFVGGGAATTAPVTTQEVCFETRHARSLAEAEAIIDAYVHSTNTMLHGQRVRGSEVGRILRLKRRKKLRQDVQRRKGNKRIKNRDTQYVSEPDLGSRTVTSATASADSPTSYSSPASTSMTTDPLTTAAATSSDVTDTSNPTTTLDTRAGEGAISTHTTSTSPEGAINCIVIRKTE